MFANLGFEPVISALATAAVRLLCRWCTSRESKRGPWRSEEPLLDKDPLLQGSWAKDALIAKVLPPTANEEQDARLVVWDIVLIQG